MEILKGMEMLGKSLWLPRQKILIVADLHIGYEESLNKQGILVPRQQFNETRKELESLFNQVRPETVIINGDLKHEFGEISQQEWYDTLAILSLLKANSKKVVLIKGNHDTILEPIARIKGLEIKDYYCINENICVLHGDKVLLEPLIKKAKIFIIAHEHAAISLHDGVKSETYKCFLLGKWKGKKIVVMPSFLPIIEGYDISNGLSDKEHFLSPFIKGIENFQVFVLGDKIYNFGRLKDIDKKQSRTERTKRLIK